MRSCDYTRNLVAEIGKEIDDLALEEESKKKCQSTIDYCTQPNTARLLDRNESRVVILAKIKLDLKGMLLAAPLALPNETKI